jgi:hypothetical protein
MWPSCAPMGKAKGTLLAEVQAFERASLKGEYYELNVSSKMRLHVCSAWRPSRGRAHGSPSVAACSADTSRRRRCPLRKLVTRSIGSLDFYATSTRATMSSSSSLMKVARGRSALTGRRCFRAGLRAWAPPRHLRVRPGRRGRAREVAPRQAPGHGETNRDTGAEKRPVRADLASGDLRALYLDWLLCAQVQELDEDALEPPVPARLDRLQAQRSVSLRVTASKGATQADSSSR